MEEREFGNDSARLCATLYNLGTPGDAMSAVRRLEVMERIRRRGRPTVATILLCALYSAGAPPPSTAETRAVAVLERPRGLRSGGSGRSPSRSPSH